VDVWAAGLILAGMVYERLFRFSGKRRFWSEMMKLIKSWRWRDCWGPNKLWNI